MPTAVTYPGVYIEEIPSGVRTITGVSTSVTAFVGSARRGPINRAVRLLSFADFERAFGGLRQDAELGYAVRQFFQNGGSEAWVVRIAKNAVAATRILLDDAGANVLTLTARDEGKSGNRIEVSVSHATANPASTFTLTLEVPDPEDPRREQFTDLSMNSTDPRYVEDVIADGSELVTAERVDAALSALAGRQGQSVSGALEDPPGTALDVATLIDSFHNEFRVSVNGGDPVQVLIAPSDVTGTSETTRLTALCKAIEQQVQGVLGAPAFTCVRTNTTIEMKSGLTGDERSSVRVLPGARNDASARLKLGPLAGGTETDAVAVLRPAQLPEHGSLQSGTFAATDLDGLPSATSNALKLGLDSYVPEGVVLDLAAFPTTGTINAKLETLAAHVQAKVRQLKASSPAYSGFTAQRDGSRLLLASGTRGIGSAVGVEAGDANDIAGALHLLSGATATRPLNATLQNGDEQDYTDADVYNLVIADRAKRKGLYALESVDIFNLLCLPGVTNAGTIADAVAYCEERRAFMIVDPPSSVDTVPEMETLARGASLPKSDHAAVYFPWVKIADPLRAGKLRTTPPSGTIAGLYARTDGSRGVWKAPAGTEAALTGVQAVAYPLTDGENGVLNPRGVNGVRLFPVIGPVAWGARTLRGDDQLGSEYKYIPIRRLALFIEESLYRGTQWAVFEPNDEPLWAQIRLNLGAFMQNLFRQGAFQGKTPREAYLVKCDSETTTQNDINLGVVNILIGFAPLKPAEFVIIRIQQQAGQIEA
jgi:phage tail sheath protein FI